MVHVSVCTFSCVWRGICRSIAPEVVYQRVVVQVASSRHLAELAISPGGRSRAPGTCVCVHIFVRMERNLSVDRARGGLSESCRTSRLHLQLSRVGDFTRRKESSTWYMCLCAHFRAYGEEFVGRSRPRWSIRELSYKSPPPATAELAISLSTWYMCLCGRFVRSRPRWKVVEHRNLVHVVHVSVCTFSCVWRGICRSIAPEVVYQRVVVQVASSRHLAESPGGRSRRFRPYWKVSSTWYMCPCAHFRAYGEEFVGRSRPRWSIRELSYKSPPAAT